MLGLRLVYRRFLWLPLTLQGETRWLKDVYIEKVYTKDLLGCYWRDIRFVERPAHWGPVDKP